MIAGADLLRVRTLKAQSQDHLRSVALFFMKGNLVTAREERREGGVRNPEQMLKLGGDAHRRMRWGLSTATQPIRVRDSSDPLPRKP